jgi:hypothetical protein
MRLRYFVTAAVMIAASLACKADTYTYTYTGNNFTGVGNDPGYGSPYTVADSVNVTFTLASPLLLADSAEIVNPLSFSFSDGVQTITNLTPGTTSLSFGLETNGIGSIIGWSIFVEIGTNAQITTQNILDNPNATLDLGLNGGQVPEPSNIYHASEGYNFSDPGTWTVADNVIVAPTPEPSSLALLGTGILGGLAALRRRFIA